MATIPTPSTAVTATTATITQFNNHRDSLQYLLGSSMTGGGGRRAMFIGNRTTAQSVATGLGYTAVTLGAESVDYDSGHSTVTNTSRYTAATAGYYFVSGTIEYAANATGVRGAHITVSGSDPTVRLGQIHTSVGAGTVTVVNVAGIVFAAASAYIELQAQQTSGGNLDVSAACLQVEWRSN